MIQSFQKQAFVQFIVMLSVSFSIYYFQELYPLRLFFQQWEIFFHEIGHGFVALAVGGKVEEFNLTLVDGFVRTLVPKDEATTVSFSGYVSASFFGLLLFTSSLFKFSRVIKVILIATSIFWLFFAKTWLTAGLLIGMTLALVGAWYLGKFGCWFIRFVGVYVMMSSIYSPTYLFAHDEKGDHLNMAKETGSSPELFIILWTLVGLLFMATAFVLAWKKKPEPSKPETVTAVSKQMTSMTNAAQ